METMDWKVEFRLLPRYLSVTAAGEWTTENITEFIDAVKEEADRENALRILLDLRGVSKPAVEMIRYMTGMRLAGTFDARYKISAVARSDNLNHFAENVAVNRGIRIRAFSAEKAAVDWLLEA
jgi:hypothetical protein